MATTAEQLALELNDRVRWCPDPPTEGTVVGRDRNGVMIRWDSDSMDNYYEFNGDRRWIYISVEEKVRVRAVFLKSQVQSVGMDYGTRR